MTTKIVLIRHGQSVWNQENRFTGWIDVDLSGPGVEEAKHAAMLLKKEGFEFDLVYTSVLKRAIRTAWTILSEMDQMWLPVTAHWRLNERHYGALQGMNKKETAQKFSEEQVFLWRRSYDVLPPLIDQESPQHPSRDPRYQDVPKDVLPRGEALKQTVERVIPYWESEIAKKAREGKKILVVAHGNSLRALVQYFSQMTTSEIVDLNIPTAVPLICEFNSQMKFSRRYYLGDPSEIEKKAKAVAEQGSKA